MTLLDALLEVNKAGNGAMQLTDLAVGTVESTSPLTIRLDVSQAALQEPVLILTEAVIEKKIQGLSDLTHTHTVSITSDSALSGQYAHTHGVSGSTGSALGTIVCYENGEPLASDESGVTINRGLIAGDKVILLAVQQGQKYIVLSRVF